MKIHFVLVSEGSSEEPLVAHLQVLCLEAGAAEAAGYRIDFGRIPDPPGRRVSEQMRWIVEYAPSVNFIFIHRDADARDDTPTREIIDQGIVESRVSLPYVAVVPIQELEAWLLLDEDAIRWVAGNPSGKQALELPKARAVEARANPKEILQQAIVQAAKPGRRKPSFPDCRRRLLERLDLEGPLRQLSAWQRLRADVKAAIAAIGDG